MDSASRGSCRLRRRRRRPTAANPWHCRFSPTRAIWMVCIALLAAAAAAAANTILTLSLVITACLYACPVYVCFKRPFAHSLTDNGRFGPPSLLALGVSQHEVLSKLVGRIFALFFCVTFEKKTVLVQFIANISRPMRWLITRKWNVTVHCYQVISNSNVFLLSKF